MQALYRKYRPQTFADVISQEAIKTILKNAVAGGRISHAYLFTGPRGVGKTTVARILAKAVNCDAAQNGEPDEICENCQLISQGRFLDLIEIDAASYTGVDNMRDIIDHVKFSPTRGRYKVFIIDEVHMLSKAAFNALLKTLEEPPAHAIFILATTEIHKVPATIISRSQRFDFRRVSEAEILQLLKSVVKEQKAALSDDSLELIARAAEGSFRDGLSILDQILSFGSQKIGVSEVEEILGITRIETTQSFLELLLSRDSSGAAKFIKNLSSEGRDTILFVKNFLEYLRLVMLVKIGIEKPDLGMSPEARERLEAQSSQVSNAELLQLIKTFLEVYRESKFAPVAELPALAAILAVLPQDEKPRVAPQLKQEHPQAKDNPSDLHLGMVVERWADVLSRIKEYNQSLVSSLRLGRLVGMEGLNLHLAFPYTFHKETIDARKNRIVVEQVLEDIFGQKLRVKVYLEKDLKNGEAGGNGSADNLLEEAMKVLGTRKG